MSKIKNRGIISKMAEISDLPLDIARGSPLFQMYSDRELLIECVKNIEYYDERRIKIRTCNMFVTIGGNSLNIRFLTNKNMIVSGCVESVSMEYI